MAADLDLMPQHKQTMQQSIYTWKVVLPLFISVIVNHFSDRTHNCLILKQQPTRAMHLKRTIYSKYIKVYQVNSATTSI